MSAGSSLHPIEQTILKELGNYTESIQFEKLVQDTGLTEDQVRRGIEWLRFKDLISIFEKSDPIIELLANGKRAKDIRLPERRLVASIDKDNTTISRIIDSGDVSKDEINAAIASARRNGWIKIDGNTILLTDNIYPMRNSPEESLINRFKVSGKDSIPESELDDEQKQGLDRLLKRPNYVIRNVNKRMSIELTKNGKLLLVDLKKEMHTERQMTTELITSGRWKEVTFSALDVEAPAPAVYPGRRHPLMDIIEEVKEIFVGLSFSEIDGPVVQSGFWNFDALFTPQDHPAREMQDTFYVSGQRQAIPATSEQKRKVAEVHKKGWGSRWDAKEAERVVLRTHTTPVTLQHLANVRPDSGRFFSVGRVFRNEKVSYKHLVEFHQVEGVATAPHASLRDLMGLQKEFYAKMGIKKVKFWPTFFPYTEPSLQSMVYNEKLEKWVELFGMGIFRPEVTEPLGIKNPVLAWGGGLERIAMLRFGLDDVRELYGNRLAWLRSVPRCQL